MELRQRAQERLELPHGEPATHVGAGQRAAALATGQVLQDEVAPANTDSTGREVAVTWLYRLWRQESTYFQELNLVYSSTFSIRKLSCCCRGTTFRLVREIHEKVGTEKSPCAKEAVRIF